VTEKEAGDLYDRIIQVATWPVLILLILMSIAIINFLMSPKWQQARRSKQIRKAVAEREKLAQEHLAEADEKAVK